MSETTNTTNTTYKQFLDKDGLVAFWNKVMSTVTDIITSRLEEFYRKTVVQFGGEHTHNVTASADVTPELEVTNVGGTLVIACKSKTINIDVETNAVEKLLDLQVQKEESTTPLTYIQNQRIIRIEKLLCQN